jgi:uncharacterized radical SAM superfamily Fe-S cluster-containing enzyme
MRRWSFYEAARSVPAIAKWIASKIRLDCAEPDGLPGLQARLRTLARRIVCEAGTDLEQSSLVGCNLRCVFCQTFETSQQSRGQEVTAEELAEMMLRLQKAGCHNINFVTPEQVVPQIITNYLG